MFTEIGVVVFFFFFMSLVFCKLNLKDKMLTKYIAILIFDRNNYNCNFRPHLLKSIFVSQCLVFKKKRIWQFLPLRGYEVTN